MEKIIIPECMMSVVDSYYRDNGKKLYNLVDKILFKLHFVDVDKNDFYSLANEVFMYAVRDYESSKSFDGFLYSCLYKKFCTEMTKRNREKRKGDRLPISIDAPIGDDENSTFKDVIADKVDIENEVLKEQQMIYSEKMLLYLSRLSELQKKVLQFNSIGYQPNEIRKKLHINEKQYADCYAAIHSYRNISVLF